MSLKGKIALVTGASQGIGRITALTLAKEGANVVVNYIGNKEAAEKVVEEIKQLGQEAMIAEADVSNFNQVKEMIDKIKERFGKLSILVNNAGIVKDRTLKNMTPEEWQRVIDINLTGAFNVTKHALTIMENSGSIVNISSVAGLCGNFGQSNYAATKAGIIGFTKTLGKELGKRKITVNAVAPGFIETDMTRQIPFIRKKMIQALIPLKEFGQPEDVANAIAFLASDKAKYITGDVLNVGGGLNF